MILLDDNQCRRSLFPFTHIRHTGDIRMGIFTIKEKWEKLTGLSVFSFDGKTPEGAVRVPANIIPDIQHANQILDVCRSGYPESLKDVTCLLHPRQIFECNDKEIRNDIKLIINATDWVWPETNQYVNREDIFIHPKAKVSHSVLNAENGPIFIGENCEIMEGCLIRGPFAMCSGSLLKMGTKIYGATTLGPYCIGGGEIKNSVFLGYSNKAHDGYLGDSVIGEWCNLGAGSSNSNIRNNASPTGYQQADDTYSIAAGLKAGLLMGDYSKCAVNTSFNTATTIGVCCNIFGENTPPKFVPNFSWGNTRYKWDRVPEDIKNWMRFKGSNLTEEQEKKLYSLYHSKD